MARLSVPCEASHRSDPQTACFSKVPADAIQGGEYLPMTQTVPRRALAADTARGFAQFEVPTRNTRGGGVDRGPLLPRPASSDPGYSLKKQRSPPTGNTESQAQLFSFVSSPSSSSPLSSAEQPALGLLRFHLQRS